MAPQFIHPCTCASMSSSSSSSSPPLTDDDAMEYPYAHHPYPSWSPAFKKASLGSQNHLSIYIPPAPHSAIVDPAWSRSQCPPVSASTSSSSSLANAVDCDSPKHDLSNLHDHHHQSPHVLSHSHSLPQMHISRCSQRHHQQQHRNSNAFYPHPIDSANTYQTVLAPGQPSPTDSPLLSPYIQNDQYTGNGHSCYGSFSLPMNMLDSYSYNTLSDGSAHYQDNMSYSYTMIPSQMQAIDVQQKEPEQQQQEQACDPRYVSGHEIGGGIDHLVAQAVNGEDDVEAENDSEHGGDQGYSDYSSRRPSLSATAAFEPTYSPHYRQSQSPRDGGEGGGEDEDDAELDAESDDYDYDDARDGDYIYRDRSRSAAQSRHQHHQLSFSTMGDMMSLDDSMLHVEATVGITASGRRRAATESAGPSPYGNENYPSPAGVSTSTFEWNPRSPFSPAPMHSPSPPLGGGGAGAGAGGMRTRAGTTIGHPSSSSSSIRNRYSPYPSSSAGYDNFSLGDSSMVSVRSRRASSYSSEASSSAGHSHPPLTPNTPGTPISPSIGSSSSAFSSTTMGVVIRSGCGEGGGRTRSRPSNSLPAPVPIPNLTKKSRGRRVPTVSILDSNSRKNSSASSEYSNSSSSVGGGGGGAIEGMGGGSGGVGGGAGGRGGKGVRVHTCKVPGCGKCFARGEHLKRHIRSIHTYDKPHKCPYLGCGKDFSRHDNLGQHMRVHKDYRPPR
ncbi:hypothetical protein D9757_006959 [Collybiopsis confluens]|uniref:C2H2-type domain-containing protein n=1 Tax=Collybiopsis confluens TaxID=2823264 RepID=A0A8H5HIP7_9AGAR|nr:hypothetical protein D9757_006959 [Collybiopsis confluens]